MHNLLWQKVVTGYFRIEGGGIAKRQEALWGWQLYSLSMVMVSQVHVYVKAHQRLYLKYVQFGASQVALVVKNPPANAGDIRDSVRSLGWEDPLEEGMGTHYSILAWRIPRTEEPGRLQPTGSQRVRHDWSNLACTHTCTVYHMSVIPQYKAVLERGGKKEVVKAWEGLRN